MKIQGPNPLRNTTSRTTKKSADGDGFARELAEAGEESQGTSGVVAAGPVASIDALLALQETEDQPRGDAQAKRRAEDILDVLEGLRRSILAGAIPVQDLERLSGLARAGRAKVDDPRLEEVLDAIDLRAQVELAKYQRR